MSPEIWAAMITAVVAPAAASLFSTHQIRSELKRLNRTVSVISTALRRHETKIGRLEIAAKTMPKKRGRKK